MNKTWFYNFTPESSYLAQGLIPFLRSRKMNAEKKYDDIEKTMFINYSCYELFSLAVICINIIESLARSNPENP